MPVVVLGLSLAIIFLVRYFTVMSHIDMGQDIANYIITMNTLFGQDPVGMGLLRPPLIAVLLKPFTLALGTLTGAKLLGVIISVALAIPFYMLARRVCIPWIAAVMAILFVLTPAYSAMLTWGYITMFGIFFTILALHFFISILERPSVSNVLLAGLCASLIAGFHQLTLVFFAPLLVLIVIALLIFSRRDFRRNYKPLGAAVILAAILSTPYLPVYLHLLALQVPGEASGLAVSITPLLQAGLQFAYLSWLWGIMVALALAVVAISWLWRQDKNRALLLAMMLSFSLLLSLFVLPPPFVELNRRAHYFMYIPIWLLVGVALSQLWSWRIGSLSLAGQPLPRLACVALAIVMLSSGAVASHRQTDRGLDVFGYLDHARWEAVQQISQQTGTGAKIVTYPAPLGHWLESLALRNSYRLVDRDMAPYQFERERSLIADRLLSRNQGLENGYTRLAYSYPHTGAPGDPVLAVYVGGIYQDVLMFDDASTYIVAEGSGRLSLETASKTFSIHGNGDHMEATATYEISESDVLVTQQANLLRASPEITILYTTDSQGAADHLEISMAFCMPPTAVVVDSQGNLVEIVQELETAFDGVVEVKTHLIIETQGALLSKVDSGYDRMTLSFVLEDQTSAITLSLDTIVPNRPTGSAVIHYSVADVIRDNGIDYLAVDFKPESALWGALPHATQVWLGKCPYYELVYSSGTVRLYKVDASALY